MSIESARLFIDRMKTDESFAAKCMAIQDADARRAFVKGEGFEFSAEEISEVKGELSDEELDQVSGGGWKGPSQPCDVCEGW